MHTDFGKSLAELSGMGKVILNGSTQAVALVEFFGQCAKEGLFPR